MISDVTHRNNATAGAMASMMDNIDSQVGATNQRLAQMIESESRPTCWL